MQCAPEPCPGVAPSARPTSDSQPAIYSISKAEQSRAKQNDTKGTYRGGELAEPYTTQDVARRRSATIHFQIRRLISSLPLSPSLLWTPLKDRNPFKQYCKKIHSPCAVLTLRMVPRWQHERPEASAVEACTVDIKTFDFNKFGASLEVAEPLGTW